MGEDEARGFAEEGKGWAMIYIQNGTFPAFRDDQLPPFPEGCLSPINPRDKNRVRVARKKSHATLS
jgi:hypothetical protein